LAVCPSCRKKKGKRTCPALGGLICPKCCGSKRIVEIHCPPDCRYLGHEQWQGERLLGRTASPFQDRYLKASSRGRDRFHAVLLIDMVLSGYLRDHPDFPLVAIRDGLRYLRRLASPLETVEGTGTGLEEHLKTALKPILDQGTVERDRLAEAAEQTLAFFEESVLTEEDLRSWMRFVGVFSGGRTVGSSQSTDPDATGGDPSGEPEGSRGDGGSGGGLILPP